eukprot:scaffold40790_cov72-Phaeocystis_antarctica.AAC.1
MRRLTTTLLQDLLYPAAGGLVAGGLADGDLDLAHLARSHRGLRRSGARSRRDLVLHLGLGRSELRPELRPDLRSRNHGWRRRGG